MSVQYMFYNRTISKKELIEKTNLKIEHHNGHDWIVASETSNLKINPQTIRKENGEEYVDYDNISELENHGFKDVKYILDELVIKFNLLFYTDNEFYQYVLNDDHIDGVYDIKLAVRDAMRKNGNYKILDYDKGIVEICEGEITYPNNFKEPFTELNQLVNKIKHFSEDQDLPF